MRSNELAQLAGVTVRTLRHYHSIGLMPEPARSPNGYRDYDAFDLARLLRIKRLASLGFPLARIQTMLQDMDDTQTDENDTKPATNALDELDQELALQIEHLQEKRRTIQLLKREQLDPGLPIRFARAIKLLYGDNPNWNTSDLARADQAALTLTGHLYAEEELAEFERLTNTMDEQGLIAPLQELSEQCYNLPADADQATRDALVQEAIALFEPLLSVFDAKNWEGDWAPYEHLIMDVEYSALNDAQKDVSNRVMRAIEHMILANNACEEPL